MEVAKEVGKLFYIVSRNESTFKNVKDLPEPDYVTRVCVLKCHLFNFVIFNADGHAMICTIGSSILFHVHVH